MKKALLFVFAIVILFEYSARADVGADFSSQLVTLQQQMAALQETVKLQQETIQKLSLQMAGSVETATPASASKEGGAIHLPSEEEWQSRTAGWLKGLDFDGDFKLRYDALDQAQGRADRNRFREAFGFGFKKNFGDDFLVGLRLGTGEANTKDGSEGLNVDPTTGYQSFTNKFSFKNIWIREGYARYMPSRLKGLGPIRSGEIGAGKMPNPYKEYSSSIVWDPDVRPEGAYEKIEVGLLGDAGTLKDLSFTALFSQFVLGESAAVHGDQEMYGYTGAFDADLDLGLEKPAHYRGAFNVYDFVDIEDNVLIGATSLARTNTSTAAGTLAMDDWNIMQFYQEIAFKNSCFFNRPLKFWLDFAGNAASKHVDSAVNSNERLAMTFGGRLNKLDKKGSWESGYQFFRIDPNAVLAAFNESDLGTGYTDKLGNKIWGGYALTDNLSLTFTAWFVDDLTANANNDNVKRFQTDLTWKW